MPRTAQIDQADITINTSLMKERKAKNKKQPWNSSMVTHETDNDRTNKMRRSVERIGAGEGVEIRRDGEIYVPVRV